MQAAGQSIGRARPSLDQTCVRASLVGRCRHRYNQPMLAHAICGLLDLKQNQPTIMKASNQNHSRNSILLIGVSLLASQLQAKDWPQWRGPHRDGISQETGLLKEWPKDGPKLLWQVKDIGAGYSTPAIVGDRLYLVSNEGLENEFALALSTKDGSRAWSAPLGKVGNSKQQPSYPGSRSTPTVEGDVLYALGSDGDLVCLDKTKGKERWRRNLRTDFGGKPGEWAYSESPLIDGNALICTPGGSNATMVALNKKSGEVIWKCAVPGDDEAAYASPIAIEAAGVKQYVQFVRKGLIGVEAKTGKFLWCYEKTAQNSPAVIITPVAEDGLIYSG